MLCRVTVIRTDVSEECVFFIIRVNRMSNLGTLAGCKEIIFPRRVLQLLVSANVVLSRSLRLDDEGAKFFRNI
jgi:hypothetical protein